MKPVFPRRDEKKRDKHSLVLIVDEKEEEEDISYISRVQGHAKMMSLRRTTYLELNLLPKCCM